MLLASEPASTCLPSGMAQVSTCVSMHMMAMQDFDCADPVGRGRRNHWIFPAPEHGLEAFLVSTGVVALAEIGDKTQLLAFMLSARYRKAWPIIFGILVATIVNHGLAGVLANWLTEQFPPVVLSWALGVVFALMAAWVLIPDKLEDTQVKASRLGVLATTLAAFFLAEMGDKTQFATVAMVAQYQAFGAVVAGSTAGMMLANVPAVLLGGRLADRLPLRPVRIVAAIIFSILALLAFSAALGITAG